MVFLFIFNKKFGGTYEQTTSMPIKMTNRAHAELYFFTSEACKNIDRDSFVSKVEIA